MNTKVERLQKGDKIVSKEPGNSMMPIIKSNVKKQEMENEQG